VWVGAFIVPDREISRFEVKEDDMASLLILEFYNPGAVKEVSKFDLIASCVGNEGIRMPLI
jgi:hypothetical protein